MRFVEHERFLSCVHCGLCLTACPTYAELGTEADSPRGRIALMRALEEGRLELTPEVAGHLDGCLGCRACEPACPSGVPYGSLIEAARPYLEARRPRLRRLARRVVGEVLTRPTLRRLAFAPARALGGSRAARSLARSLRGTPLGPWLAYAAAVPAARPRPALPFRTEAIGRVRGTALFLTGCVAETLFPDTARATAGLLALAGVRVIAPTGQGCCGALSLHLGDAAGARDHARRLLEGLPPLGEVDWAVSSAAGCGALLRELDHLLPHDPRARRLAAIARDPLALLAELGLPKARSPLARRVAVHDPCHLAHGQGVREEPRALLRAAGAELVDLEESDTCCGSAGTYNLTEPAMAERLAARKLAHVEACGAEVVAAANPGCLLQIRAGAITRGLAVAVEHPLDLLARAHGVAGS